MKPIRETPLEPVENEQIAEVAIKQTVTTGEIDWALHETQQNQSQ